MKVQKPVNVAGIPLEGATAVRCRVVVAAGDIAMASNMK